VILHLLRPKAREDGTLPPDGSVLAFEQKARRKQARERARKRCEDSGETLPPPPCTEARVAEVTGKSPRVVAASSPRMALGPDGSRGFCTRRTALVLQEETDQPSTLMPGSALGKDARVLPAELTGYDGSEGLNARGTPPAPQDKADELRDELPEESALPLLRAAARPGVVPGVEALGVSQLLRLLWLCLWAKVVGLLQPVWPAGKAKLRAEAKEFVPLQVARVVSPVMDEPDEPRPVATSRRRLEMK
jgi:hypothetical protein